MRKQTALVLTGLLMLTAMLTMPLYVPQSTADPGLFHYNIKLSQRYCNANVTGTLENAAGVPIAAFLLECTKDYQETKVQTDVPAVNISFTMCLDWDQNGVCDKNVSKEAILTPYYRYEEKQAVPPAAEALERALLEVFLLTAEAWPKWKITLAQKNCNANVTGYLTENGVPIECTGFLLDCVCGGSVYTKIATPYCTMPNDIHFTLVVDWNKDGVITPGVDQVDMVDLPMETWPWQFEKEIIYNMTLESLGPVDLANPVCTLWHEIDPVVTHEYHLQDWQDNNDSILSHCDDIWLNMTFPDVECSKQQYHVEQVIPGPTTLLVVSQKKMVAIEVEELDPWTWTYVWDKAQKKVVENLTAITTHDWQIQIKTTDCAAQWTGNLTRDGSSIPNTKFNLLSNGTQMQCQANTTAWCTIPNDILYNLSVAWDRYTPLVPILINMKEWFNKTTAVPPLTCCGPQFPWRKVITGPAGKSVELEVTEVEVDKFNIWGGITASCVQLGGRTYPPGGTGTPPGMWASPYQSRAAVIPYQQWQNVMASQKDPITGIVKLSVPAASYKGLDQEYFSTRVGTFFKITTKMYEQGCGYIFTGQGKDPIYGDVDLITFNNDTGVYTYGPDGKHTHPTTTGVAPDDTWNDDMQCIADPCLKTMSGIDGIPGTGDPGDVFGDGTIDPKGSAILYMPLTLEAFYYDGTKWTPLFSSPWPTIFTTATASDTVIEPGNPPDAPCRIDNQTMTLEGHPHEHLSSCGVSWKDPLCNVWSKYACVWSVLQVDTVRGKLDVIFCTYTYSLREDFAFKGDVDRSGKVDWVDLGYVGGAYGKRDEYLFLPFEKYAIADFDFNPYADFNVNNKIDWPDLGDTGLTYGQDWRNYVQTGTRPTAKFGTPNRTVNGSPGGDIHVCDTVVFNCTASKDTDGRIVLYILVVFNDQLMPNWVVGFAAEQDPWVTPLMFTMLGVGQPGVEAAPGHFPSSGTYHVYLYVVDDDGLYGNAKMDITVLP